MPITNKPIVRGELRSKRASTIREAADLLRKNRGQVETVSNEEELINSYNFITNFTKGLPSDDYGIVSEADYSTFRNAINQPDKDFNVPFDQTDGEDFRKWESPIAGHLYDLQGADAADVAMPPAPKLNSAELAAEMAEDYAAALLRDTSFKDLLNENHPIALPHGTVVTVGEIVNSLKSMPWFNQNESLPDLNDYEKARRSARLENGELTLKSFLRGSSPGCQDGPYISQFMYVSKVGIQGTVSAEKNKDDLNDGTISYGAQRISQKVGTHEMYRDYMQNLDLWKRVQKGKSVEKEFSAANLFKGNPERYMTLPRDLAAYVHVDQLYQAYLNACLIMLSSDLDLDRDLPDNSNTRKGFASFGGPHILSLVTEVATRALKAVRRQKFNYHCRARPEFIAGLINNVNDLDGILSDQALLDINELKDAVPADLLSWIKELNTRAIGGHGADYLLPMAFPEGSPMHPSYGAGHATVAGACVTILKAFFEMYDEFGEKLKLSAAFEPNTNGSELVKTEDQLTLIGELNKLAANISIGRDIAGVHYYSDYYESLRMGEKIAVGILQEQMITYEEPIAMTFETFDGDKVKLQYSPPTEGFEAQDYVNGLKFYLGNRPYDINVWWKK